MFDNTKIKIARKPGKKQKENPVGCTREGKKINKKYEKGTEKIILGPPVFEFGGGVTL